VEAASLRLRTAALGAEHFTTALEVGANIGINLANLHRLFPDAELSAIEINPEACASLRKQGVTTYEGSLLDIQPPQQYDLTMSVGVLIHIDPHDLPRAYDLLYHSSQRLILLAEYYSPTPVEVAYRGQEGALWKRDFAGDLLDFYPDLEVKNVGFLYRRQATGQDDLTWFLLEKRHLRT